MEPGMAKTPRRLRLESLETRQLLAGLVGLEQSGGLSESASVLNTSSVVAVTAENLQGLRSAEVQLNFEAGELDVAAASVKAGAAWQGKASIISKVDEASGTLNVFVFSVNPIATSDGELLAVEFDVSDEMAEDVSTQIALTKFELNEGTIDSPPALHFDAELEVPSPVPEASPIAEVIDRPETPDPSGVSPHVTQTARSLKGTQGTQGTQGTTSRPPSAKIVYPASVLPPQAFEVTSQVALRGAARVQSRVLPIPVVGPDPVQQPALAGYGYYFEEIERRSADGGGQRSLSQKLGWAQVQLVAINAS
jgi:hypothetical protein